MTCYYQGCTNNGTTKEHIPPRSFFPKDQRNQLLTVTSCELHNNAKSPDDIYVLAQICMNTSPSNRSREIFMERVLPQLGFNGDALRKTLAADAVPLRSYTSISRLESVSRSFLIRALVVTPPTPFLPILKRRKCQLRPTSPPAAAGRQVASRLATLANP